jgi:hypothetical protein
LNVLRSSIHVEGVLRARARYYPKRVVFVSDTENVDDVRVPELAKITDE